LEPQSEAKFVFIPTFKTQSGFVGFRGDVDAFFERCPLKTLISKVFASAGFRINVQFKTMTEALEFKHNSTSLASSSHNHDERDQSSILSNDKDTVSDAMPNSVSNMIY
jgi:hypothetical protein